MTGRIAGLVGVSVLALQVAYADTPPGQAATPREPATSTSSTSSTLAPDQRGLALGVEVGEPTSLTVAWWFGKLGVAGAIGTGTRDGIGRQVHIDALLEVARLKPAMPLRVGLGARYYHHGYDAMSFDEIPDSHYGLRADLAIAYELDRWQLYVEVAPGVDFKRTTSCTLVSGAYSVCPHAQENPVFLQLVLGARWFLKQ